MCMCLLTTIVGAVGAGIARLSALPSTPPQVVSSDSLDMFIEYDRTDSNGNICTSNTALPKQGLRCHGRKTPQIAAPVFESCVLVSAPVAVKRECRRALLLPGFWEMTWVTPCQE
eukprot:1266820-Amphidinium_carterae.1